MKTGQDLDEAISEHQHLVKVLRSTSHDDDRREAKKQAAELKNLRRQKVRDGLPAKPAPEPYPGVEPGDSLYIHHPERGPLAVKVHAQGRHGVTATDSEGNWHRAKWRHVLGAKQRLSQRLTLVDQGEDGAITEDESGQRRYVAINPEARPDPEPLRKSQPTAAQIEAGNYKKQHLRFQGLEISIENPKGSVRTGTGPGGKSWRVTMHHAYGYIRGTCGVDKDHVDCYLGPNPDASHAYVVHQRQAGQWSRYDEDKVMLGFDSAADAKSAYLAQYDDPRFFGTLTAMPMADFKRKALATRNRPQMIKGLVLFFKTHIDGFANAHGTFVAPHEDKRMPAKEPSEKGSGSPLIKPATPTEIEAFVADVLSNRSNNKGRLVIDIVSNSERLRIQAETGVNVGESSKILLPSTVIHATNEHPNLIPADWRQITDVLREFDGVFLSLDKGRNQEMRLAFIRLAGTPEAYGCVVDVAKGKKRGGPRLNVATFYRDHLNMVLSLVRQSAAKKDEVDRFVARLSAQGRLPSDRLLRSTPPPS